MEEQERRRRLLEDATIDLQNDVAREIERQVCEFAILLIIKETLFLEEQERARRIVEQQQMLNKDGHFVNEQQHEAVQQEFMAKVHRKQASEAEEKERQRRIDEIALQVKNWEGENLLYCSQLLLPKLIEESLGSWKNKKDEEESWQK